MYYYNNHIEDSEEEIELRPKKKQKKKFTNSIKDLGNVYAHDNHIYFYSSVSKDSILKLNDLIIEIKRNVLEAQKKYPTTIIESKPIYLHINSYGGSVFAAYTAIDIINNSSIPIYTIIEGASASAATLISVCGKKRYMCKNASMLIHQLSSWMSGKMNELDDEYQNLEEMMNKIKNIYLENTKIKKNEIDELLKHDLWWDFEKSKKYGLFDNEWVGEE